MRAPLNIVARNLALAALLAGIAVPCLAQERNLQRGFVQDGVYQELGLDNVDVFNGNVSLTIPIGEAFPVDGKVSYGLNLSYNSKVWDYHATRGDATYPLGRYLAVPSVDSNAGMGWLLSPGRLIHPNLWEAPDGAPHPFFTTLHEGEAPDPNYRYTRDGSYLRIHQHDDGNHISLELPGGVVHEYELQTSGDWYLKQIHDHVADSSGAFVNTVDVDYTSPPPAVCSGDTLIWHFVDKHHRESYICYKDYNYPNDAIVEHGDTVQTFAIYGRRLVDKVVLPAFQSPGQGATAAVYELTYTTMTVARGCGDAVNYGQTVDVPMLTGLRLPNGETYGMQYFAAATTGANGPDCQQGAIQSLKLPTLGKINWTYEGYTLPTDGICQPHNTYAGLSAGVQTRQYTDASGNDLGTWSYQSRLTPTSLGLTTCDPGPPLKMGRVPWEELQSTVTDPRGNRTVSYFSVWQNESMPASPNGFRAEDYGLPFTRFTTESSGLGAVPARYLSSRTFAAGATAPLRETYVAYEEDAPGWCDAEGCYQTICTMQSGSWNCVIAPIGTPQECNRNTPCIWPGQHGSYSHRVRSSLSRYLDDGNSATYSDSDHFDGLGHYRQSISGASDTSQTRTAYTNFNSEAGDYAVGSNGLLAKPYVPKAPGDPWLLETYSDSAVTDGASERHTLSCFEPKTGFLLLRRTLAGSTPAANDLLAAFTADHDGNVASERYYGGELSPLANTSPDLCNAFSQGFPAEQYRIDHTYQYGTRHTSQYVDGAGHALPFKSFDVDLDPSTGLISTSRDGAGLATSFQYDLVGRITDVKPSSGAWTHYTYNTASDATNLASVDVDVRSNGGGTLLGQKHIFYDALGRAARVRNLMADGSLSQTETLYDRGLKASVSSMQSLDDFGAGSVQRTTFDSYDPFGRLLQSTPPDGVKHRVSLQYFGFRRVVKTVGNSDVQAGPVGGVATGRDSSGNSIETSVITTETYDPFGRLVSVSEPSGVAGAHMDTSYGYTAGDELASTNATADGVTQTRTFNRDGRGLLTSDSQPETGTTNYTSYDARGHLRSQNDAVASLSFDFDRAERQTKITDPSSGPLAETAYDRPNSTGDFSLGKADSSTRHNYQPALGGDVTVKETYTYGGVAGAISQKKTTITPGPEFTDKYEYDDLGNLTSVTYPSCTGCGTLVAPARKIDSAYVNGFLTRVGPYTSATNPISYLPNGMIGAIHHRNADGSEGPTYTQTLDATRARLGCISVTNYCDNFFISSQPSDRRAAQNQPVTLTVAASGGTSYQWYAGATGDISSPVMGQTTATLTLSLTATASFWVRVGNQACFVDSRSATISVTACSDLNIRMQPQDALINSGSPQMLSVAADSPSGSTVTYQWYQGLSGDVSHPLAGATAANYVTPILTATTRYWVRVSLTGVSCSQDSVTATVRVCQVPVLVSGPLSQTVALDASVTAPSPVSVRLTVIATGDNLTFAWYDADDAGHALLGSGPAFTATYSGAASAGTHHYYVEVRGCGGSVRADATVTVYNCRMNLSIWPPAITVAPDSTTFTLTVGMNADPTMYHYQWYHGIGNTVQAVPNSDSYMLSRGLSSPYDAFWCVVSLRGTDANGAPVTVCSNTTPKAYAWVVGTCPLPPVSVGPTNVTVVPGQQTTFAAGSDWPAVTYQWYAGSSGDTRNPIAGQTGSTLTVPSIVQTYWVRVTDECGVAHIDSQTLTVAVGTCSPIVINQQPQSAEAASGAATILRVDANTPANSLSYTWFQLGSTVPLGTNTQVTVHPTITTSYYAQIGQTCGTGPNIITSATATVHVRSCAGTNITRQPANVTMIAGTSASLLVTAAASDPLSYQWYSGENGDTSNAIAGGTLSTLSISPSATTSYWVRVTTATCAVDSQSAVVKVCHAPAVSGITVPNPSLVRGQSTYLTVQATGTDLTYQWYIGAPGDVSNPVNVGFPAWPSLTVTPQNTTTYWARVTGACGVQDTGAATITVCMAPAITQQPVSVSIFSGATATLSVTATESTTTPINVSLVPGCQRRRVASCRHELADLHYSRPDRGDQLLGRRQL